MKSQDLEAGSHFCGSEEVHDIRKETMEIEFTLPKFDSKMIESIRAAAALELKDEDETSRWFILFEVTNENYSSLLLTIYLTL